MTLDEMRKEFEGRFTVHPSYGDRSIAPTGETYTEVMSGMIKGERLGTLSPLYRDEASCIEALLETLTKYAVGKVGVLYWRIPPEVDFMVYRLDPAGREDWMKRELRVWRGYARLLISDKPVIVQAPSAA